MKDIIQSPPFSQFVDSKKQCKSFIEALVNINCGPIDLRIDPCGNVEINYSSVKVNFVISPSVISTTKGLFPSSTSKKQFPHKNT